MSVGVRPGVPQEARPSKWGWTRLKGRSLGNIGSSRLPVGVTLERAGSVWAGGWCFGGWGGGASPRGRGVPGAVRRQSPGQAPTFCSPTQKRRKTSFMLPPFSMEMTRRWSSSFTHTRKLLLSLCLRWGAAEAAESAPGTPFRALSKHIPTARGQRAEGQVEAPSLRRTAAYTCGLARTPRPPPPAPRELRSWGPGLVGAQVCEQHSSADSQDLSLTSRSQDG